MTLWTRLCAFFQIPPDDFLCPPLKDEAAEDRELRRRMGLSEIHRAKADNLAYFADHKPQGYAFTFGKRED